MLRRKAGLGSISMISSSASRGWRGKAAWLDLQALRAQVGKLLATIEDAAVTTTGADETGQVSDGWIRLRGRLLAATYVHARDGPGIRLNFSNTGGGTFPTDRVTAEDEDIQPVYEGTVDLDEAVDPSRDELFALPIQDGTFILIGLLLRRRVTGDKEMFTKPGLFRLQGERPIYCAR